MRPSTGMSDGGARGGPALHHRQVVIGPEPFRARPDWRSLRLDSRTFVSHCPSLRNGEASDADGARWILLGLAVQTIAGAPDPLQGIAQAHSSEVPELCQAWSGRWLLVGAGRLHLDASGLLGCFYGRDANGRAWASSSPGILAELIAADGPPPVDPRELPYYYGVSWYPPPRSRLVGAQRLLPSQVLDVRDGTPGPRPLLPPIEPGRPYDETLELLQGALVEALRRLPATPQPLALALSAGLDSRVVLAAAERAAVPYVPFTRIAARMSPADRLIPPSSPGRWIENSWCTAAAVAALAERRGSACRWCSPTAPVTSPKETPSRSCTESATRWKAYRRGAGRSGWARRSRGGNCRPP